MTRSILFLFAAGLLVLALLEILWSPAEAQSLAVIGYIFGAFTLLLILTTEELTFYNPITYLLVNLFVGIFARSLIIAYIDDPRIDVLFTRGKEAIEFTEVVVWLFPMLVLFIGGYATATGRFKRIEESPESTMDIPMKWTKPGYILFQIVFLGIAALGTFSYINKMGIADSLLSLEGLSTKRHLMIEGRSAALGYERWASSLTSVVYYASLILYLGFERKEYGVSRGKLAFYFFLAVFFPFVTSSRSTVLFTIINSVIIYSIFRKIQLRHLLVYVGSVLFFFQIMTELRKMRLDRESKREVEGLYGIVAPFLENRNLFDLSKTAHIFNSVPEEMPFMYGSSFMNILYAPIPRTMWKEKPDIQIGLVVASDIYDIPRAHQTAIPPGLMGEMYMNFGVLGIIFGVFLYGYSMRWAWSLAKRPNFKQKPMVVLLYVMILLPGTFYLLGASIQQASIRMLQFFFAAYAAHYLMKFNFGIPNRKVIKLRKED